jgi:DNA recombination protein RmuC
VSASTRLVPVDAKFPLEDFRRMLEATEEAERQRARKAFLVRVRKHVDAIAAKYILPDEGTYDFALMYVPAENVYYETIIRSDAEEEDINAYALAKRVIPVSPGSFFAYLQALLLGFRGLKVEEKARHILEQLSRLEGDLERFREDFRVLGKHVGHAAQCYTSADKRLERIAERLATVGEEETPVIETQRRLGLPGKE